ncbi:MAG: bifunctional helix-turn-helix domain-containing protein/methylated-DNA--[protein]-cysteine S-methyltransferase [Alphaproteobacteria bacterium]
MPPAPVSDINLSRIADAIRFLTVNRSRLPSLDEAAAHAGMSPTHFQRVFSAHVGISPKRFLSYLTLEVAKSALSDDEPVLGAAFAAGLSGPGRLHDLFVNFESVTPGEFKAQGFGLELAYGFAPTPFGLLLCVSSERGIVGLAFADPEAPEGASAKPTVREGKDLWGRDAALADMKSRFPSARFNRDDRVAQSVASALFAPGEKKRTPIKLCVTGTNFQVRVWEALLKLPAGHTTTYAKLAGALGDPRATRAVASAVGRNPVSLIIPCHRVLRTDGGLGGYHWGLSRKRALLAWERAQADRASA